MSDRSDYFSKAESWATDVRTRRAQAGRRAYIVAGMACAAALFEAVAIALMMPLKTVQPVTLLVDRQTGFVQALDPLSPRRVSADEALTQAYLAQYVTAREGFDRATIAADYKRVALWSTGSARGSYLALMPATNPTSPFQQYRAGTLVQARVKSVSRLSQGVALVRFDTQLQDRSGRAAQSRPWVAIVRYRYSDAPMRLEDRFVNPLGFQVSGYRRDAEAPVEMLRPVGLPGALSSSAPAATDLGSPPVLRRLSAATPRMSEVLARPTGSAGGPEADDALPEQAPRNWSSRREVPIDNLPLGSPLSSATATALRSEQRR